MVYRGKPSAGCENCRKARKRCSMERPACSRCINGKKACFGYRDISQLVVRDQTEIVREKVEREQARYAALRNVTANVRSAALSTASDRQCIPGDLLGIVIPADSDSGNDSDESMEEDDSLAEEDDQVPSMIFDPTRGDFGMDMRPADPSISNRFKPKANDVASDYFFRQFTSNEHWSFMWSYARPSKRDPCLDLAMRACGMAALTNVKSIEDGKQYARFAYVDALNLVNRALGNPISSKTDETLIAVVLLGYYENIIGDRFSIPSWQAHVNGTARLLELRGEKQFESPVGRQLFRETRSQILTQCIWDYQEAPKFLEELQSQLTTMTDSECRLVYGFADRLSMLVIRYAKLRTRLNAQSISYIDAAIQASDIERRLVSWSSDASQAGIDIWRFNENEIEHDRNVRDGRFFEYRTPRMMIVWNTWRCFRIMLSRTQEMLCSKVVPLVEREKEIGHFQRTRRKMTDEICATVPSCVLNAGHDKAPSCALFVAYNSIWTLFFAGTCALERVGYDAWSKSTTDAGADEAEHFAAYAQAEWILSRLSSIAQHLGLRWADSVASPLRGEFQLQERSRDDGAIASWTSKITTADRSPWLKDLKQKCHKSAKQHECSIIEVMNY